MKIKKTNCLYICKRKNNLEKLKIRSINMFFAYYYIFEVGLLFKL